MDEIDPSLRPSSKVALVQSSTIARTLPTRLTTASGRLSRQIEKATHRQTVWPSCRALRYTAMRALRRSPALEQAVEALETATNWIVETFPGDPAIVAAGATHYLRLMGVVSGGWLLILGALRANRRRAAGDSDPFLEQKLVSARFFAEQYLPQAAALKATILQGGGTVTEVSPDAF